jgi:hypothetical protein
MLQRDITIWKLRQRLRSLLILSFLLPGVCMLVIFFIALPDLLRSH